MAARPLRVVQWATGNIGSRSLQSVVEHPQLELVGVWVHSAEKMGTQFADVVATNSRMRAAAPSTSSSENLRSA